MPTKRYIADWHYAHANCIAFDNRPFEYNMMLNIQRQMTDLYEKPCQMFNVGAMMPWMDYTPRTADEIIQFQAAN